jgi:hypothetical protein
MSRPHHLADRFVAPALDQYQIAYIDRTRTEQPRAPRMDVIGARRFYGGAPLLPNQAPAHWNRQMHNFASEQSVFLWFEFPLHDYLSALAFQLRRSYQYMSDRTMYGSNPKSGY